LRFGLNEILRVTKKFGVQQHCQTHAAPSQRKMRTNNIIKQEYKNKENSTSEAFCGWMHCLKLNKN